MAASFTLLVPQNSYDVDAVAMLVLCITAMSKEKEDFNAMVKETMIIYPNGVMLKHLIFPEI